MASFSLAGSAKNFSPCTERRRSVSDSEKVVGVDHKYPFKSFLDLIGGDRSVNKAHGTVLFEFLGNSRGQFGAICIGAGVKDGEVNKRKRRHFVGR